MGDRRVPGGLDREGAALQVQREVDRRREALLPLLPVEVAVGCGQEVLGAHRAQQAPERAGQQQRAGTGFDALAGHVDQGQLEPGALTGQGADDEVAGERTASRRSQHRLRRPAARQGRQLALSLEPVPQLDDEGVPGAGRQPGLLAGAAELVGQDRGDHDADQRTGTHHPGARLGQVEHHRERHHGDQEPHRAAPQQQTPAQQRQHLRRGRHDLEAQPQPSDDEQHGQDDETEQTRRLRRWPPTQRGDRPGQRGGRDAEGTPRTGRARSAHDGGGYRPESGLEGWPGQSRLLPCHRTCEPCAPTSWRAR